MVVLIFLATQHQRKLSFYIPLRNLGLSKLLHITDVIFFPWTDMKGLQRAAVKTDGSNSWPASDIEDDSDSLDVGELVVKTPQHPQMTPRTQTTRLF